MKNYGGARVWGACVGAALLDVIFTCSFIALLAAIAIPSLHGSRDRERAVLAGRYLAGTLQALRIEAIRRNRPVALRLDPDDIGSMATYVDGDGDGVLQSDVDSGVDTPLAPDANLRDYFAGASFRIPFDVPAPDGGGTIAADSDPVRIGNSNFLSFSPLGTATSGTLYLTGGAGTLVCIRVLGATGRIRLLTFHPGRQTWLAD